MISARFPSDRYLRTFHTFSPFLMPSTEALVSRVGRLLTSQEVTFETKTMMGVLVFMVDGKMSVGVKGDALMVRLDPSEVVVALRNPGCQPMRISGRTLRGFILVEDNILHSDKVLGSWLKRALAFKPKAVAPKRRARSRKTS